MKYFILLFLTFFSLHAASITLNKPTYNAGESITVTLTDVTGQSNNWVGIFQKNTPNNWAYDLKDKWFNFKPNGTLTITAPQNAGDYEIRLFYNDSLNMVKKVSFKVNGAEPTITLNKTQYNPNENISVNLANIAGVSNNWVGIFKKNDLSTWDTLIKDNWFNFKPNGTLTIKAPSIPGDYSLRLFYNDSLILVKSILFKVKGAPLTLSTNKLSYKDNETITVSYHNVQGASNNWIGLFRKGSASTWANDLEDKWLTNRNGTVTFSANGLSGDYEVRIFYNDSLQKEKTSEFTVNKVIVPRAPTMYEDAEDGLTLGWYTTGGPYTAKNIYAEGSRIINGPAKWVGDHYPRANEAYYKKGDDNGNAWNNTDQFILDFDTIGGTGCMTYGVEVRTLQGSRSINFSTWFGKNNYPPQKQVYSDGYVELTYAIPVALRYAGRHHVRYDLNYYLKLLEPDNEIIAVDAFHCSGYSSGAGVDNIRLLSQ